MTDSVLWMSPINPLAGTCKQSILESQWRLLHYCVLGKDEDFIQKYAKIIAGSKVSSIAIDKFFKKFLSLLVCDLPWNTSSTLKIWWNTLADSKKRERGLCSSRKIVMKNSPSMQIADNLNSQGWKCTKLYILNRVQGKKKNQWEFNALELFTGKQIYTNQPNIFFTFCFVNNSQYNNV